MQRSSVKTALGVDICACIQQSLNHHRVFVVLCGKVQWGIFAEYSPLAFMLAPQRSSACTRAKFALRQKPSLTQRSSVVPVGHGMGVGVGIGVGVGVGAGVGVGGGTGVGVDVGAGVGVGVGAGVGVGSKTSGGVGVGAGVGVGSGVSVDCLGVDVGVGAGGTGVLVGAGVRVGSGIDIDTDVGIGVGVAGTGVSVDTGNVEGVSVGRTSVGSAAQASPATVAARNSMTMKCFTARLIAFVSVKISASSVQTAWYVRPPQPSSAALAAAPGQSLPVPR